MQNNRDTIPNQRTKPASNAGLMDKGHRMASGTMDDVTRLAILTNINITGTSTSTPTTVANAAPNNNNNYLD